MDMIISAIAQGLLWGSVSLGLFISFRVLHIADMTTEGSFPLGAVVCVTCIYMGIPPILATLLAVVAGMLAGLITGFLMTVCRIPSLLAGILTMTGLLSINLRIMKRPNLAILNEDTIFTPFSSMPERYDTIVVGLLMCTLLIGLLYAFFETELGQSLMATGDSPQMATAFGISTRKMTMIGLMLSNGIISFAGAILSQNNRYADVNGGLGVIVIALAAIIIGEVLFSSVSFVERLICTVFGAIIYRFLLVGVLKVPYIDTNDVKLISAVIIALCLTFPSIKQTYKKQTRRKQ